MPLSDNAAAVAKRFQRFRQSDLFGSQVYFISRSGDIQNQVSLMG